MIYFSVVIPLYNKQDSITGTLNAVLNQSYNHYEIIVVDDGSTDASLQRAKSIVSDKIHVISKTNGGVCSARNLGIESAKYEYIAFLDADDVWEATYLETQAGLIDKFDKAAMWGVNFAPLIRDKEIILFTGLPEGFCDYVTDYFRLKKQSDLFCSSSVVVRKPAFAVAGLFDERIRFSEDLDMWYRIILHFPVVFYDKILVHYRHDAENRALNRERTLTAFLPYFVDKYDSICAANKEFSYFIHTFSAAHLRLYYFGKRAGRHDAKVAVEKLRYNDIHPKYKWWYKTPYVIGWCIYKLTGLKHKISSK